MERRQRLLAEDLIFEAIKLHISIEGMDAVGKTTVARKLAKELNMIFVEKPLKYLFSEDANEDAYIKIRDYVNIQDDRVFTSWFYGLGNIFLYHKFGNMPIITDRHILSNYAWSGESESEKVFDTLVELIGVPDHTFILYADADAITSRMNSRDPKDPNADKIVHSDRVYQKMRWFADRSGMPYSEIDSTNMDIGEVFAFMLDTLRQRGIA